MKTLLTSKFVPNKRVTDETWNNEKASVSVGRTERNVKLKEKMVIKRFKV